MQSKISSFFKPSSSSTKSNPKTLSPIFDDPNDDLIPWENIQHQFFNTYKRRIPRLENEVKKIEANKRPENDVMVKPISKVMNLQESSISGKLINKKRSYAQLHLDLGQSDFNLKTCSICGVKYAPGEEGDEKEHKIFHKNYTCGVWFKGCHNERVVHLSCNGGNDRIVLVLDSDPSNQRNKVQEVIKMMEIELGDGWIFHKLCKVYLFISSQRVVGCLVAEPIKEAFKILPCPVERQSVSTVAKVPKSNSTTLQFGEIILQREITKRATASIDTCEVLDGIHNGAIICEEKVVPAVCGIRAIWVTPSNRRKHIASQLLDAMRRSFRKGLSVKNSELAFSPPTAAGRALASTYTATSSFLLYKPQLLDSQIPY